MDSGCTDGLLESPISLYIRSFNQCLAHAARLPVRQQSAIEDQLGRLKICMANIDTKRAADGALDSLNAPLDLCRLAPRLVGRLNQHIQRFLDITLSLELRADECTTEKDALVLDALDNAMKPVVEEINLLHHLSNSLYTAKNNGQIVHVDYFSRVKDADSVGIMYFVQSKFPGSSQAIQQRLAAGMLLRRQQILDRRSRHCKISQQGLTVASEKHTFQGNRAGAGVKHGVPHNERLAARKEPAKYLPAFPGTIASISTPESQETSFPYTHSEFTDTAWTSHIDGDIVPSPLEPLRQRMKEMIADKRAAAEIICPYCCCTLSSMTILSDKLWMDHLHRDLNTYVCLFESCDVDVKVFTHIEDWLRHMRLHNKRWRCASKSHGVLNFHTQWEYEDHVVSVHKSCAAQVAILSKRSSRLSGHLFEVCPLCQKPQAQTDMEVHLAGHFKYLALASIPFQHEGGNDVFYGFGANCEKPDASSQITETHYFRYGDDSAVVPHDKSSADDEGLSTDQPMPSDDLAQKFDRHSPAINHRERTTHSKKLGFVSQEGGKRLHATIIGQKPLHLLAGLPSAHSAVGVTGTKTNEKDTEPKATGRNTNIEATSKGSLGRTRTQSSIRVMRCPLGACKAEFYQERDWATHVFSHYKHNMACGFCPEPDLFGGGQNCFDTIHGFKEHLVTVHGAEEKSAESHGTEDLNTSSSPSVWTAKLHHDAHNNDTTGKCSMCAEHFKNAQDLYEHINECLVRTVEGKSSHKDIRSTSTKCEDEPQRTGRDERRSRKALVRYLNVETLMRGER